MEHEVAPATAPEKNAPLRAKIGRAPSAAGEAERAVNSSSLGQVRRPIYTSSIGPWRNCAAHLRPLEQALGLGRPALPPGTGRENVSTRSEV
jgi:hypothetical protein